MKEKHKSAQMHTHTHTHTISFVCLLRTFSQRCLQWVSVSLREGAARSSAYLRLFRMVHQDLTALLSEKDFFLYLLLELRAVTT